ncbi:MAG TPA: ACP S-malonyltransferase [Aliidongia sp.]|uniref:ACP S-malonyltransferase n=1 Tax=Aliidongia sp. TaxID=1914230 RepID=UPI002DDD703B|nr:ACP S-malonyltransferase [Aliidongia sp.]HEV2678639.1 ACP S-malonyltransferase [Aliidongia sp.]
MTKRALVFPGQGSQAVGMGVDLAAAFPVAREVFQETDDALEQGLSKLMAEGPIETLTLTENAQPALLAMSVAVLRVLEKEGGFDLSAKAAFVAGHSLGEYSALAAAGAFALPDAVRLVRQRGRAMQAAVPVGTGAMVALLGVDLEIGQTIAREASEASGEICTVANDNGGGQLVLSGHKGAVEKAVAIAAEKGFKKAIMLPVSAPFHSPLMAPAADVMAQALGSIALAVPAVPLVANVTASAVRETGTIRTLLVSQVTGLVRWRETVLYLKEQGVSEIVELGAGKVLAGLVRRIDKEIATRSISAPADIEAFLAALQ